MQLRGNETIVNFYVTVIQMSYYHYHSYLAPLLSQKGMMITIIFYMFSKKVSYMSKVNPFELI